MGVNFIILLFSHKLGGLLGLCGVIIKHTFHLGTCYQTPDSQNVPKLVLIYFFFR